MMDTPNIADGIAVTLLLAGLVLTSGAIGVMGSAPVLSDATVDGPGDGPDLALAFPINNLTASSGSYLASLDGKGNDPIPAAFPINNLTTAFPIDNVTVSAGAWDVRETDLIRWTETTDVTSRFRLQDMDPYAVPEGSDGLPQDMDPY